MGREEGLLGWAAAERRCLGDRQERAEGSRWESYRVAGVGSQRTLNVRLRNLGLGSFKTSFFTLSVGLYISTTSKDHILNHKRRFFFFF